MENEKKNKISWTRFIPLLVIIILMVIAWFTPLRDLVTFDNLKTNRNLLIGYVQKHFFLTSLIYIVLYIIMVALSIPGAALLSLIGGFLFMQPLSTIYVVVGATIGASIIFLAARTAFGEFLKKKAGALLHKMEEGFRENAISYMFFLRLVPLFPFWLVNLAPAFFGVGLFTFVWTTFLGIIPGSFVFTQAGSGLGAILDTEGEFSIGAIFNWQIRIALIALGIFALIPVVIKKIRKRMQEKK